MKGTAMPAKTASPNESILQDENPPVDEGLELGDNAEIGGAETDTPQDEPEHPLIRAKVEMVAAIDALLAGYSRVGVARVRDAIDGLRAAIPARPPVRSRGRRL